MKTVCLKCFDKGRYTVKRGVCPVCGETRGMLYVDGKRYESSNIKLWPLGMPGPVETTIKEACQE